MSGRVHQIAVDHSESRSALLDALRRSGVFELRMARLTTGDYLLNDRALVERKSVADFATSLIDGRLFPQVARLAHSGLRTLTPHRRPRVELGSCCASPHSRRGARIHRGHVASPGAAFDRFRTVGAAAAIRRRTGPRIAGADPETIRPQTETARIAPTVPAAGSARRRSRLASRLLSHFGSIEGIVAADVAALAEIRALVQ